jgi:nucleoside 2-deoxyribosyltransferase
MTGKGYLRTELKLKAHGFDNPISTNHAIVKRDQWMIGQSDIVLVDLTGAERVSIGCMFELAWAMEKGKHTIVIMEKDNIHQHAFVIDSADIVFETPKDAMDYLEDLSDGKLRTEDEDIK